MIKISGFLVSIRESLQFPFCQITYLETKYVRYLFRGQIAGKFDCICIVFFFNRRYL